ncbi:hypothetical protein FHW96_000807 [Novosphingobium sp. SG751A]|uniref:hypothetical protein n=1 Tax=Novosphingobium sp. SG751A TaxID=2587000 RepID=UPI001555ACDE|nr:hypothetical protein [Novosphingobium sp. SG751A]NOW44665.1 hypothetical protein [Novosphingobium sp. SG751A]
MLHDFIHNLAPLMWTGIILTAIVLRHRRKMAAISCSETRPTARAQDAEVEALRERIRVLERIATSSSLEGRSAERLSAEIEALRDR